MYRNFIGIIPGCFVAFTTVTAQETSAPPTAPKAEQAPAVPDGKPPEVIAQDERKTIDYLYNGKPKEGTAADKAAILSELLGDKIKAADALSGVGSLISPEFESFLNTSEAEPSEILAYEDLYNQAVDLIRKRQVGPALEILIDLSQYPWDGGTSEQLANRVLAIWDMRRNQKDLTALNTRLAEKARAAAYNFDQHSTTVLKGMRERDRQRASQRSSGGRDGDGDSGNSAFLPAGGGASSGGFSATPAVDAVIGKMQLTEEYLRGMEARVNIKLNESEIKEGEAKARKDFVGFISVLSDSLRHHQTKLAADFYRVLFGDGDLPVEVAQKASDSGEIIQRVRGNVEVFEFKTQQGNYASATKIMLDDFNKAPNHPVLRGIKREQKLKVADYLAQLQKIQNLIEARDFGTLEVLLEALSKDVKDFDPTKPRALVKAVKRESQMRLGVAKLAAQQGNLAVCRT